MKTIFYFFASAVCLISCLDSSFDTTDLIHYNDINYLPQGESISNFPNDPYRIVGIVSYETSWEVIVEYSGGCEEHIFYTWWDGQLTTPEPVQNNYSVVQASFWLAHNSNGDACDRTIRDTLQLDLQSLFQSEYPDEGVLVTTINAHSGEQIVVDPSLLYIQKNNCELEASLVGSLCGTGIWDNQWLLLYDSTKGPRKIWLQPVKSNLADGFTIPGSGQYMTRVRLLFGFQYSENDSTCTSTYQDTIIPVAVTCLEKL